MSKADEFDEGEFDGEDEFDEDEFEEQNQRIAAVLGEADVEVSRKSLKKYLGYLKQQVERPCQLTGLEDFLWEEFYVIGPGSKKEYQELKKTRPSYTDTFELLGFVDEIDENTGLLVRARRTSDNKEFTLELDYLKTIDENSKNYQLLDDYTVWFVNHR